MSNRSLNRRGFLARGLAAAGIAPLASLRLLAAQESPKRNIILIMADDVGYECFGCYGSRQYRTPRLDKMAAGGVRFTNCHSTPLCTPSRVKIMTGRDNVRNYVDFGFFPKGEKTFSEMLKAKEEKDRSSRDQAERRRPRDEDAGDVNAEAKTDAEAEKAETAAPVEAEAEKPEATTEAGE